MTVKKATKKKQQSVRTANVDNDPFIKLCGVWADNHELLMNYVTMGVLDPKELDGGAVAKRSRKAKRPLSNKTHAKSTKKAS